MTTLPAQPYTSTKDPSLISRESRTSKNTKQGKGLLNNSTLAWINSNIPAIDVEEFYIG